MITLHPSSLALLVAISFAAGGASSFYIVNKHLERVTEERNGYYGVAVTAVDTSHKAIGFAEAYKQETDACIQKIVPVPAPPVKVSKCVGCDGR